MVQSMTAFARCEETAAGCAIGWELRAVNHRFLDVQFRLPDELRALEYPLREAVAGQLKRGKVMCVLAVSQNSSSEALELNRPLLLQLLATLERVRRDAPEAHTSNPMDLLRWPGMLQQAAISPDGPVAEAIKALFKTALDALVQARRNEGEALKEAITKRLDEIDGIVAECRRLSASVAEDLRTRLQARLAELKAEVAADRLAQEVALLAQKADVAEELDRLAIHLNEARSRLNGPGPHGRRLDFLAQELMREANTLAAKSVLPSAAGVAVDLKVAIDQIREQVQNLE